MPLSQPHTTPDWRLILFQGVPDDSQTTTTTGVTSSSPFPFDSTLQIIQPALILVTNTAHSEPEQTTRNIWSFADDLNLEINSMTTTSIKSETIQQEIPPRSSDIMTSGRPIYVKHCRLYLINYDVGYV